MINLSFLERKIWYQNPNVDKKDFVLNKSKDRYGGFIYKYIETDIGFKKRIKQQLRNNKNRQ